MGFYIGQEVECVDATDSANQLVAGHKYILAGFCNTLTKPGVFLVNVPNQFLGNGRDFGWWLERFRPLTSRPTSISIFTAMLRPKQKETLDG